MRPVEVLFTLIALSVVIGPVWGQTTTSTLPEPQSVNQSTASVLAATNPDYRHLNPVYDDSVTVFAPSEGETLLYATQAPFDLGVDEVEGVPLQGYLVTYVYKTSVSTTGTTGTTTTTVYKVGFAVATWDGQTLPVWETEGDEPSTPPSLSVSNVVSTSSGNVVVALAAYGAGQKVEAFVDIVKAIEEVQGVPVYRPISVTGSSFSVSENYTVSDVKTAYLGVIDGKPTFLITYVVPTEDGTNVLKYLIASVDPSTGAATTSGGTLLEGYNVTSADVASLPGDPGAFVVAYCTVKGNTYSIDVVEGRVEDGYAYVTSQPLVLFQVEYTGTTSPDVHVATVPVGALSGVLGDGWVILVTWRFPTDVKMNLTYRLSSFPGVSSGNTTPASTEGVTVGATEEATVVAWSVKTGVQDGYVLLGGKVTPISLRGVLLPTSPYYDAYLNLLMWPDTTVEMTEYGYTSSGSLLVDVTVDLKDRLMGAVVFASASTGYLYALTPEFTLYPNVTSFHVAPVGTSSSEALFQLAVYDGSNTYLFPIAVTFSTTAPQGLYWAWTTPSGSTVYVTVYDPAFLAYEAKLLQSVNDFTDAQALWRVWAYTAFPTSGVEASGVSVVTVSVPYGELPTTAQEVGNVLYVGGSGVFPIVGVLYTSGGVKEYTFAGLLTTSSSGAFQAAFPDVSPSTLPSEYVPSNIVGYLSDMLSKAYVVEFRYVPFTISSVTINYSPIIPPTGTVLRLVFNPGGNPPGLPVSSTRTAVTVVFLMERSGLPVCAAVLRPPYQNVVYSVLSTFVNTGNMFVPRIVDNMLVGVDVNEVPEQNASGTVKTTIILADPYFDYQGYTRTIEQTIQSSTTTPTPTPVISPTGTGVPPDVWVQNQTSVSVPLLAVPIPWGRRRGGKKIRRASRGLSRS